MRRISAPGRGATGVSHAVAISVIAVTTAAIFAQSGFDAESPSTSQPPLGLSPVPVRPPPLIEWGDGFLRNGNLQKGFTLPTGEVIAPNFWVFGALRSAFQTFDTGSGPGSRTTEWVNRLDLFGNLQLTPTERVLAGWRPVDQRQANGADDFSGFRFEPSMARGFVERFSGTPTTLFFEGELGEIFPRLDDHDRKNLDYGFAIGRQPLTLQDGLLANSLEVDMLSVTRNSLRIPGGSTLRLSGLVAVGSIERPDYLTPAVSNVRDPGALLFGLDAAADFPVSTVEGDLLFEASGGHGSAVYGGLGAIQRLGAINTTFRSVASVAVNGTSGKASTGALMLGQFSYTLPSSANLVYLDVYWGLDRFSAAVRDPTSGGPLGNVGILNAAVGLGAFGAPLSNQADHSAGGAIGCQIFFDPAHRKQIIFEVGGRVPSEKPTLARQEAAAGVGVKYQQALGRRYVVGLEVFGVHRSVDEASVGARAEFQIKF